MEAEDPDDVPVRLKKPEQAKAEELAKKLSDLTFYAVMNSEGKFFRAKGYGGYGETWTSDLKRARIYGRIGPARATVSFFANNWSQHPTPALIEMKPGSIKILDETERVKKVKLAKIQEKAVREEHRKKRQLEWAKEELDRAQKRLREAKQQAKK